MQIAVLICTEATNYSDDGKDFCPQVEPFLQVANHTERITPEERRGLSLDAPTDDLQII